MKDVFTSWDVKERAGSFEMFWREGHSGHSKDEDLTEQLTMMESLTPLEGTWCARQHRVWRPSPRQRSLPSSSCAPQLVAAVAVESKVLAVVGSGGRLPRVANMAMLRWLSHTVSIYKGCPIYFPLPCLNSGRYPLDQLRPHRFKYGDLASQFHSRPGKAKAHGGKFSNIEVRCPCTALGWWWPRYFECFFLGSC